MNMFMLTFLLFTFSKLGHCPMTSHYYFLMKNSDFEWNEHID